MSYFYENSYYNPQTSNKFSYQYNLVNDQNDYFNFPIFNNNLDNVNNSSNFRNNYNNYDNFSSDINNLQPNTLLNKNSQMNNQLENENNQFTSNNIKLSNEEISKKQLIESKKAIGKIEANIHQMQNRICENKNNGIFNKIKEDGYDYSIILSNSNNFDKDQCISTGNKINDESSIDFQDKINLINREIAEQKKILNKELEDQQNVNDQICDIKSKENRIKDIEQVNQNLEETTKYLIKKFKESENIRNQQSELIKKLQKEINGMRGKLMEHSPNNFYIS
ncbi:MAG: hypothetical protein MJ252_00415 [archaeon]|nr:hypothetical protein [archaeon]